jgi:HSP20 family protein
MQPHCHPAAHPLLKHLMGQTLESVHASTHSWTPRVDIFEEEQRFVILTDIPGIDPKEIEIEVDKDTLIVKGERSAQGVDTATRISRSERWKGSFVRKFDLPDIVDPEAIEAKGNFGVLEISLPKRPQPTPRRINIS